MRTEPFQSVAAVAAIPGGVRRIRSNAASRASSCCRSRRDSGGREAAPPSRRKGAWTTPQSPRFRGA